MNTSKKKKILISARDPGAAGNLAIIAQLNRDEGRFEQTICATPPADDFFIRHGLQVQYTIEKDLKACELLTRAERVLAAVRPDILLVGLSGPGIGIDEALLKSARSIPKFAFQDFWGDINPGLGSYADLYLVQDQLAADFSTKRHGVACEVVGLPKYTPYHHLNPGHLRSGLRRKLCLGPDVPVAGFCGQPLWQQSGYRESIEIFLQCLSDLPEYHLLYRPHPKEDQENREEFLGMVQKSGVRSCRIETSKSTEPFLACCDSVVSAFSNCGLDLAYLNRLPGSRGGVPVYLRVDPRLCNLYERWTGLSSLPLVDMGLALSASSPQQLTEILTRAQEPDRRQAIIAEAGQRLPDPATSGSTILRLLQQSAYRR